MAEGALGVTAYVAPVTVSLASTGCAEATAYLARATGETAHPADLTTLICGLVADGVWPKLDALYVFPQQIQADAQLNLVGTPNLTVSAGAPTFTPYSGFTFTTTDQFVTGVIAPTSHFVQNSASLGWWADGTVVTYGAPIGNGYTPTNSSHIYPLFTDGNWYARLNGNSSPGVPAIIPADGLFVGDRPDAFSVVYYHNGANLGGVSNPSNDPTGIGQFVIGGIVVAPTGTARSAFISASLGDTGQTALYNRLRTYMTAVGVARDTKTAKAAVTTVKYPVSGAWVDLGAGPLRLGFTGDGVYAIADTTPAIPKSEGFSIPSGKSARVETTSHVWAMSKSNFGVNAYVSAY
jgi:hypothetical protein